MVSRRLKTLIFVCWQHEYGLYREFAQGVGYDKSKRPLKGAIENSKFLGRLVRTYEIRGWKTLVLFEQDCQSVESARMRLKQLMAYAAVEYECQGEHI